MPAARAMAVRAFALAVVAVGLTGLEFGDGVGGPATRATDIDRGAALIRRLGCANCHAAPAGADRVAAIPAPRLAGIGALVRPEILQSSLTHHPEFARLGGRVDPLGTLTASERVKVGEDLLHFVESLGDPYENKPVAVGRERVDRGRRLYDRIGCLTCHAPVEDLFQELGWRFTVKGLARYLRDPLTWHPNGQMPSFRLTEEESFDLAAFLNARQRLTGQGMNLDGLRYDLYIGSWDRLPDLTGIAEAESGVVPRFELPTTRPKDNFALHLHGYMNVKASGEQRFVLASDDGAEVHIDGRRVAQTDGVHPRVERSFSVTLDAGRHLFDAWYFEKDGEEELELDVVDVNGDRRAPPSGMFRYQEDTYHAVGISTFDIEAERVKRGKEAYERYGCAACHPLTGLPAAPASALVDLDPSWPEGCVSTGTRRAGAPTYGLTDDARAALRSALLDKASLMTPMTARERVDRTTTELRCTACHARGGQTATADAACFTSNGEAELGDEGRIPPSLTGVGAKLTSEWLERVLLRGGTARPYMATRMPQFGEAAVKHLTRDLADADGAAAAPAQIPFDETLVEPGRQLTGTGSFSCITCHTFAGNPSLGIPALDLTRLRERLRPEWFETYMLDPAALRPGTRMPKYFTDGKSPVETVLGGDASRQIHALWAYYSLGASAPLPKGLKNLDELELVPEKEPIVFRTFLEGVGPKAIAVGTPQRVHYAFDPETLRLATAWRGRFLSAEAAWVGRAGKFAKPLGQDRIEFPPGPSVALLDRPDTMWPLTRPDSRAWKGYRLEPNETPALLYSIHERIGVSENVNVKTRLGGDALVRKWRVGTSIIDLTLRIRLMVADSIVKTDANTYRAVLGNHAVMISADGPTSIRPVNDRYELLHMVPLRMIPTCAEPIFLGEVEAEYSW